ncbi:hypothetical protein D3C78_1643210 [compost metagenome]
MRIQPAKLWTATGKVFDHGDDAILGQAFVTMLEAFDISLYLTFGELVILAEGTVDAAPARFGGKVGLR